MDDPGELTAGRTRWLRALGSGDFDAARDLLARLQGRGGDARAWELELRAALWLAGDPHAALPRPDEGMQLAGQSVDGDAALSGAASFGIRAAVLAFDRTALDTWMPVHDRLAGSCPEATARAELAAGFRNLFAGSHAEAGRRIEAARGVARTADLASCVVELQILSALVALGRGETNEAIAVARRAFRMARAEALPPEELMAGLVLARVRRVAGAPHLAARILGALSELVSPPFLPWLAWESQLAGAAPPARVPDGCPAGRAANVLGALIAAATAGRRAEVDDCASRLEQAACGFHDIATETTDLLAAMDAESTAQPSRAMARWIAGEDPVLPRGLHGLATCRSDAAEEQIATGYVVAHKGAPGRRILALGAPLVTASTGNERLAVVEPPRRPRERTDAAIALLGVAGEPMAEEHFFHMLYGFAYEPALHASILSTLLHRVRATLEGRAEVHREGGRLWLEPHGLLLAWDPRCIRPVEDRILRALTAEGPQTAKRTAERLGIPLRTVQAALGELVESGSCRRGRKGRSVEYAVEDTTFSEPTLTRAKTWRTGGSA